MKILHIAPSYKPAFVYGGPTVVMAQLAEEMAQGGHDVTVYTTTANGVTELPVEPNVPTVVDDVTVYYFNRLTKDHTQASPKLWQHLHKTIRQFDVIHIHSWWNFLTLGAVFICLRHRIKPILSPHGMFSDYIVNTNNARWKQLLHWSVGKYLLRKTYLHVSTDMEWQESQRIIKNWAGQIIPNPVILPDRRSVPAENSLFTIGFLSRIDPKKGVDWLIRALSRVSFPYQLMIAGSGEESYITSLRELSVQCGNEQYIQWVGWKNAEDKFDYLSSLDLMVLTSHSENFAVVVIESLAVGTPVLVSDQVGLSTFVQKYEYGWITSMNVAEITDQLTRAWTESEKRKHIRAVAPVQIQQEYETESLVSKYIHFYRVVNQINKCGKQKKDLFLVSNAVS